MSWRAMLNRGKATAEKTQKTLMMPKAGIWKASV